MESSDVSFEWLGLRYIVGVLLAYYDQGLPLNDVLMERLRESVIEVDCQLTHARSTSE